MKCKPISNWLVLFAALLTASHASAASYQQRVESVVPSGQSVSARASWPAGALELINDPLRTEGWRAFFPGYDYHGTLTPVRMVSLAEYRQHLADTKESWVLNFEEDRNAN